ncbi:MAG: hypothetical protein ACOYOV_10515 [Bacteroidales bacterium]
MKAPGSSGCIKTRCTKRSMIILRTYVDKDHLKYLGNWFNYFSPEQFIMRIYEKSCIGDDVVNDFLKIVGIYDKTGLSIHRITTLM